MAGLTCWNPSTKNAPLPNTFGMILTLANSNNPSDKYLWRYQLGFNGQHVFERAKINSDGAWTAWKEL